MRVKQFSDFRAPSRRPWLVVVLVILALLLVVRGVRRWRDRATDDTAVEISDHRPDAMPSPSPDSPPTAPSRPSPATRTAAVSAVSPPPVRVEAAQAAERMAEGRRLRDAGMLPEAREHFLQLLEDGPPQAVRRELEALLGEINVELVANPWMIPEKITYTVQSGDSLAKMAHRFGTTVELIQRSNRIANPNRIRVGDHYRILNRGTFEITVRKRSNDLLLTLNGRFFKRYRVGTGEYGRTPEGAFVIPPRGKIVDPSWWPSDGREIPYGHPDNILGTRWMAIEATGETPPVRGYGIHGTWDDDSIGQQSSAGCIRMRNVEVEELFMLVPVGSTVTIIE